MLWRDLPGFDSLAIDPDNANAHGNVGHAPTRPYISQPVTIGLVILQRCLIIQFTNTRKQHLWVAASVDVSSSIPVFKVHPLLFVLDQERKVLILLSFRLGYMTEPEVGI